MYGSYSSSTVGASGTGPSGCGWDDLLDVWFEFTPTSGEPTLFTVEPGDWNWPPFTIALYDNCGGNELECVTGDDGCGMEPISRLVYDNFNPWQTYYIRVAREDGLAGDFSPNYSSKENRFL